MTRGRLGTCLGVRVDEALLLLGKNVNNPLLTKAALESALKADINCCRSQQKFLSPRSTDTVVRKTRKEDGGNTTAERCFVIAQSSLNKEHIRIIREGNSCIQQPICMYLIDYADYMHTLILHIPYFQHGEAKGMLCVKMVMQKSRQIFCKVCKTHSMSSCAHASCSGCRPVLFFWFVFYDVSSQLCRKFKWQPSNFLYTNRV